MSWLDDGGDWGEIEEGLPAGGAYKPVPKGDYECEVVGVTTRVIDNAKADGVQVRVEVRIIEGEYKGRRIFGGHLVDYRSKHGDDEKAQKTERIGRGRFKALCGALGLDKKPNGFDQLTGKSVKVNIVVGKRADGQEENEIGGYAKSAYFVPAARPVDGGFNPWG